MSVLDHLWAMPGVYWGLGRGPNTDFVSRVSVQPHDDGSVTLDYEAWSQDEGLQHAEAMRLCHAPGDPHDPERVVLLATSDGDDDTMTFREGESGVFGSTGQDRVGLVLVPDDGRLAFSWWWPDENGVLSQQSRAELTLLRPLVSPPPSLVTQELPGLEGSQEVRPETSNGSVEGGAEAEVEPGGASPEPTHVTTDESASVAGPSVVQTPGPAPTPGQADELLGGDAAVPVEAALAGSPAAPPPEVPWPGIVVLAGNGTGVVAQRLAERLTRAAVVRTDLFDKAVRGSDAANVDRALRHRITIAVTNGYARSGHPVILHGAAARGDHAELVDELRTAGLAPVRLVDVADGEDYGEVARRLIDGD
jgi:hypothetical protein